MQTSLFFLILMFAAASLAQSDTPCSKDIYRQFDFWIGKWAVKSPVGKIVGHNEVTTELDGCLLVEHWKGAAGKSLGSSFNYYDIRDQLKPREQLQLLRHSRPAVAPALPRQLR